MLFLQKRLGILGSLLAVSHPIEMHQHTHTHTHTHTYKWSVSCCSMLQCVFMLQRVVVCCGNVQSHVLSIVCRGKVVWYCVLQCVAACCAALQQSTIACDYSCTRLISVFTRLICVFPRLICVSTIICVLTCVICVFPRLICVFTLLICVFTRLMCVITRRVYAKKIYSSWVKYISHW